MVSLYFGGKSHVSNGQNVSFNEPCSNPQTFKPSAPQTLKPQTLRPSNAQTLRPSKPSDSQALSPHRPLNHQTLRPLNHSTTLRPLTFKPSTLKPSNLPQTFRLSNSQTLRLSNPLMTALTRNSSFKIKIAMIYPHHDACQREYPAISGKIENLFSASVKQACSLEYQQPSQTSNFLALDTQSPSVHHPSGYVKSK